MRVKAGLGISGRRGNGLLVSDVLLHEAARALNRRVRHRAANEPACRLGVLLLSRSPARHHS